MSVKAYGAHAGDSPLEPLDITRRAVGPHDVRIEIAYCGICHSDLHQVRAEWAGTQFPCVPGHEIVGRVAAVGAHVSGFARRATWSASAASSTAASIARNAMPGWRTTATA